MSIKLNLRENAMFKDAYETYANEAGWELLFNLK